MARHERQVDQDERYADALEARAIEEEDRLRAMTVGDLLDNYPGVTAPLYKLVSHANTRRFFDAGVGHDSTTIPIGELVSLIAEQCAQKYLDNLSPDEPDGTDAEDYYDIR